MPSYDNDSRKNWPTVTPTDPCPECGKGDRCKRAVDRRAGHCFRNGRTWHDNGDAGPAGAVGRPRRPRPPVPSSAATATTPPRPGTDWAAEGEQRLRSQMTPELLDGLATATGLPVAAWTALSPGWATPADLKRLRANGKGWADDYPAGAYAFVERSGDGRAVGLTLRAPDGRKGACGGTARGLVFPHDLHQRPEPFAVANAGPTVAVPLRGTGTGLRNALAKTYRERTGHAPSASALSDALSALEGMAADGPREPVALRVAELPPPEQPAADASAVAAAGVALDLGDPTGRAVVVTSAGWRVRGDVFIRAGLSPLTFYGSSPGRSRTDGYCFSSGRPLPFRPSPPCGGVD